MFNLFPGVQEMKWIETVYHTGARSYELKSTNVDNNKIKGYKMRYNILMPVGFVGCALSSCVGIAGLRKIRLYEQNRREKIEIIDVIVKEIETLNAQGVSHE